MSGRTGLARLSGGRYFFVGSDVWLRDVDMCLSASHVALMTLLNSLVHSCTSLRNAPMVTLKLPTVI